MTQTFGKKKITLGEIQSRENKGVGQTFHEKPPQVASTHFKSSLFDATYGTWKPTSVNYNLAMVVIVAKTMDFLKFVFVWKRDNIRNIVTLMESWQYTLAWWVIIHVIIKPHH